MLLALIRNDVVIVLHEAFELFCGCLENKDRAESGLCVRTGLIGYEEAVGIPVVCLQIAVIVDVLSVLFDIHDVVFLLGIVVGILVELRIGIVISVYGYIIEVLVCCLIL